MRAILFKGLVFLAFVVAADTLMGFLCKKLYQNSNDVPTRKLKHTMYSTHEDILIMGSSRAECHLVSAVVSRKTGMTVYNCGVGGTDPQFTLIQINQAFKRYRPKLIIMELSPNIFFQKEAANRIKLLLPFYKEDSMIYNSLVRNDPFARVKLLSSTYPYNSTIGASMRGVFKSNHDTLKGFLPMVGSINVEHEIAYTNSFYSMPEIPESKLVQVKRMLDMCVKNGVKVMVVSTPVFYMNDNYKRMIGQIKTVCESYKGIEYYDYTRYNKTFGVPQYFYDNSHLNTAGALMFTNEFADTVNESLKGQSLATASGK